jgi:hypothetical protein
MAKPLLPHRVRIGSIRPKRCDTRHKVPLFYGLLFAAISDGCAQVRNGCPQVKISGYGVIPCCIILTKPIREIEGGKEIQEGKARSPGAQEEGDEEGEAGQESKG